MDTARSSAVNSLCAARHSTAWATATIQPAPRLNKRNMPIQFSSGASLSGPPVPTYTTPRHASLWPVNSAGSNRWKSSSREARTHVAPRERSSEANDCPTSLSSTTTQPPGSPRRLPSGTVGILPHHLVKHSSKRLLALDSLHLQSICGDEHLAAFIEQKHIACEFDRQTRGGSRGQAIRYWQADEQIPVGDQVAPAIKNPPMLDAGLHQKLKTGVEQRRMDS